VLNKHHDDGTKNYNNNNENENENENDDVQESVIAKSTGQQEEEDIEIKKDAPLYKVLSSKKKLTKYEAGYREKQQKNESQTNNYDNGSNNQACIKCKFNLPAEKNVIS
jgi:DNA-directed RNA polymerase specialized sigma subunit